MKQETFQYNETEYMITTFPATKGIMVSKQLIKLIGPAATEILFQEENSKSPASLAMEKLVENLDKTDVVELLKTLVTGVTKNNMAINFDSEFNADYAKLFVLCKKVIEVNFGSVFTLLGLEEFQ